MDAWFSYVLGLSELIFHMKLEAYENACASLVLSAAGVQQAIASAGATGTGCGAAETKETDDDSAVAATAQEAMVQPSSPPEASPSLPNEVAAAPKAESVDACSSASGTDHGATASQSTTSPMSTQGQQSESGTGLPQRRASPPVAASAETVGALLDAMQLRRPLRNVASPSQVIDDIQAEADVVYRDLEEVYGLRPGDISALRRAAAAMTPTPRNSPAPPEGGQRQQDHAFPASADAAFTSSPASLEQQLLYGELTSVGVRQLQAISMAAVTVSREQYSLSRSQNFSYGTSPPIAGAGGSHVAQSSSYGGSSHTGSLRHTAGPIGLPSVGNVPRGAVVVGVDVGCGSGRLLFEWARLATAACRRRAESSRRRSHAEDNSTSHSSSQSYSQAGSVSSTNNSSYAAAARRGNLLAATVASLGVPGTNVVWRGWMGVGLELVPSRIRTARRALVPHYLNLKPALLVPAAVAGAGGDRLRDEPVPLLDPVAPEAIAVSPTSGSFSSPNSVSSPALTRAAPTPTAQSPNTGDAPRVIADRLPQPTARVLLYEGDALRPGVLSNGTLCRFPHSTLPGDTLTLLRGGSLLVPAKAHHLVNGLGGENMGSLGSIGYHGGGMSAPMLGGGASTCPYPPANVVAAGAALNSAFLSHASAGGHSSRRAPASFMGGMGGTCSMTSNASSTCSARGGSAAKHNYYRLCRVEGGPSLTGKEDPHLVVFCCGLGFDEAQVWRLCQRLEDMLLGRSATTSPTRPDSLDGFSSSHNISEDEACMPGYAGRHTNAPIASPVAGTTASVSSDEGSAAMEEMARGFGHQMSTPTVADPTMVGGVGGETGAPAARDAAPTYRHWESVTCVLLLRPMDVLAPNFPLFRYATRIYNTQQHPVAAEDTAMLLATGNRTDGTAARYVMRDLPMSDNPQDANVAGTIQESDVWTTTLETTWMNAAPAWVVRFRF